MTQASILIIFVATILSAGVVANVMLDKVTEKVEEVESLVLNLETNFTSVVEIEDINETNIKESDIEQLYNDLSLNISFDMCDNGTMDEMECRGMIVSWYMR